MSQDRGANAGAFSEECQRGRVGLPLQPVMAQRLVSRTGALFGVAIATVFALLAVLALRQVGSPDVGFHLRAGNYILSGNGWPSTDPFTYTVSDHPYVDTSWGYQVALAAVERASGAAGLVLFHAAFVLATFALLYQTLRLVPADPLGSALLMFVGALAAEMRYEGRPELVSYALLTLVLHLLHRHAEGSASPLWLLPVVFVVWANCHSLFILGWGAIACFLAGLALARGRVDRRLAAWGAVSVAVTLVNPYGWRALVFPFTLATRLNPTNVFGQSIGEFVSPFSLRLSEQFPFYPRVPVLAFRVLFVLVLLSLVSLVAQKRWWCVLLALPFLYLSLRMIRNMPLPVLAALPGAAWGLPVGRLLARAGRWEGGLRRALLGGVALAAVALSLRVYHDAYYVGSRREDRFGLSWNRSTLPVDAAAYVERAKLPGRMLNHLNFGGYLMWALRQPVYMDGRLEVIGERFFVEYLRALGSEAALEASVARFGIGWIIFPYKIDPRLLGRLSEDPRWRLAYVDHLATVFVREGEGAAGRVDDSVTRAALAPLLQLDALPGLGGGPRSGKLRRWLAGFVRRERFPVEPFGRGLFHYFRGEPALAAPLFAQAVRRSSGAYYEIYNNLGSALYRLGRGEEAADCYRIVLEEDPGNRLARDRLAGIAAEESAHH